MVERRKGPSRSTIEARPTVVPQDPIIDRFFWQYSSDTQRLPEGDNRYRVHHSAKFYVVQLIGAWLNVSEFAERKVTYRNRLRWVCFEKRDFELRKADRFKPFLTHFIQGGCYAYVGGKQVSTVRELNKMQEAEFIYIASAEALRVFNQVRHDRLSNSPMT